MYNYLSDRNQKTPKNNRIKVTGEGEIAVHPDSASVNLGVITESKEVIDAQQQNSIIVTKVIDSLLSLGIDKNQIKTFDYRIDSEYDFDQGKQIFRGYKITHILQVKIEDLSLVGKVVDTAVQNGANHVANIQFTTTQKESYYHQALTIALNSAISKAKTIANTLRVSLDPTPILVVEGGSPVQPFESIQVSYLKGVSSTQIEPGQLLIKAIISVEFIFSTNL